MRPVSSYSYIYLWLRVVISEYKNSNFQGSQVRHKIVGRWLIFRISFFKAKNFFYQVVSRYVKEIHIAEEFDKSVFP